MHERLRAVYERARISAKKPTHSLRHMMASDLVQSGAPIHVAQRPLRHASASVTLAVYSHAKRDGLRQAGATLEEYRRRHREGG
ncbi:MAG: tyrosine-type recombinase/integrase [Myxococcota bacterium]